MAHILVVDDDRNLRKIIQTNLELAGFEVVAVPSGADALRALESTQPDLVVLDVMMPAMDGYEVARRIRSRPSNTHVPIIMVTAQGENEDKLAGFEAGIDAYITKTFGPQELLARVRAKLARFEMDSCASPLQKLPGTLAPAAGVRRLAAHSPDTLPGVEYYGQIFWSSGVGLPEALGDSLAEFTVDSIELPPGEKAVLSVQLPSDFVIAFDPVTHGTQFIDVKGEPTREALLDAITTAPFDLGGVVLSYGPARNQGSDQVFFTILQANGSFKPVARLAKVAGQ